MTSGSSIVSAIAPATTREPARDLDAPGFYHVVLLNDDFTPMDFVVLGLRKFFAHAIPRATEIMLSVHQKGRGIAGTFARDIAETKAAQMADFARRHRYPLRCVVEPEERE